MTASRLVPAALAAQSSDQKKTTNPSATPLVLAFFCLCFLVGALRAASRNPLWMDEVLAAWVIKLPTYGMVWSALFHGSETSPPTFHLLLHALGQVAGYSYLVLRLPSILATFVTGLCIFALLRRYLDTAAAAYGMAFLLLGAMAWFGIQARPYTLVVACFAGAVLLWDGLSWKGYTPFRASAMSALLICAIFLHFYATLLIPVVAAMELLWYLLNRRVRTGVWIGLFAAGLSSFLWLPLIRADTRFNASDTAGLDYYAKPSLGKLVHAYSDLMIFDKKQILFLTITVFLIATVSIGAPLLFGAVRRLPIDSASAPPLERNRSNLYVIAACTLALPFVIFVFALIVTKTFNWRYCLVAALGLPCLIAYVLDCVPAFKPAAALILLAGSPFALLSSPEPSASVADQLMVLKSASKPLPIVIGEGRVYFELEEAAPPELKQRLVYVDTPRGATNPDPTNEHLVDRWHSLRPDLQVFNANNFFAGHPHFYVLHTTSSTDVITPWLVRKQLITGIATQYEDVALFEAGAPRS